MVRARNCRNAENQSAAAPERKTAEAAERLRVQGKRAIMHWLVRGADDGRSKRFRGEDENADQETVFQIRVAKVLVEGIIYYVGVALIEELYVRGLLLNLIEKIFSMSKYKTVIAVVLSSLIFGFGHIFGTLGQPLPVIVSKVVWTIGMGIFLGMVYKKTKNLWLPVLFHFLINVCALPYCFSSINGYADMTLYIIVPAYVILGIYSLIELKKEA